MKGIKKKIKPNFLKIKRKFWRQLSYNASGGSRWKMVHFDELKVLYPM
jgi:hypothetical protein